jgi:hypothetical protein
MFRLQRPTEGANSFQYPLHILPAFYNERNDGSYDLKMRNVQFKSGNFVLFFDLKSTKCHF